MESMGLKDIFTDSTNILVCRHGEGTHLTGEFNEERDGHIGPVLTGKWDFKEQRYTGGKGQSYRRIVRQLADNCWNPHAIILSPQMRALETCAYARLNEDELCNGTLLKNKPVHILRGELSCHEQTRCLSDQGLVVPSLKYAKDWPNYEILKSDPKLWKSIQKSLSKNPKQPPKDPKGSALPRALKILSFIKKKI